ncbi:MAG: isoprenylcysteine carboxylmethyltransferase family protein [Bacilli bacterium]
MYIFYSLLISFVITQRLVELTIAKRNAKHIEALGGFEVGKSHYKYIVLLHISFFIILTAEVIGFHTLLLSWWLIPFSIFLMAQGLRIWCIRSLGPFWNTRIYIVPGAKPVNKGPYKYLRHPNYVVVGIELLSIPLIFNAYFTAIFISILNAAILSIRIRTEEHALKHVTAYELLMNNTPRFIPFSRQKLDED